MHGLLAPFFPFRDLRFTFHPRLSHGLHIACACTTREQQLLRLINELRAGKRSGLKVAATHSEMEESSFMTLKEFCVCWPGECANGILESSGAGKNIKHAPRLIYCRIVCLLKSSAIFYNLCESARGAAEIKLL